MADPEGKARGLISAELLFTLGDKTPLKELQHFLLSDDKKIIESDKGLMENYAYNVALLLSKYDLQASKDAIVKIATKFKGRMRGSWNQLLEKIQ